MLLILEANLCIQSDLNLPTQWPAFGTVGMVKIGHEWQKCENGHKENNIEQEPLI